ncbi:hypothetical protein [Endozoicomonas lisbonensis]|uniref:C2H2-type domain-containing protein n=1 Tax=Endozoicomonas lisbonensis TaxID=3120522 RepID=A0ABV2SGZ4_9GAMM
MQITRAYGFTLYFLLIAILASGASANAAGVPAVINPALFMHPFVASYVHDIQKLTSHQLSVEPDSPGVQTVTGKTYISLFSKGTVDFEISVSGGEWVQPLLVNSLCTFQSGDSPDESKLFCKGQTGDSLLKLGLTFFADGQLSLTLHKQSRIMLVPSIPTDDSVDIVRTLNDETWEQISRMVAQQEEQKKIDKLVKKRNQFLSTEPNWLQRQNEIRKKAEEIRKIHEGEALVIENDLSRDDREYQVTLKVPVYTPELVVFDPQFSYHGKLPAKIKFNTCGKEQGGSSHQSGECGRRSPVLTRRYSERNNKFPVSNTHFEWPFLCKICRQAGYYNEKGLKDHQQNEHPEKLFHCKYCDWLGYTQEEHINHDLTHRKSLEKPYTYEEWVTGFETFEVKRRKQFGGIEPEESGKKSEKYEQGGLPSQENENVVRSWGWLPPMMDPSHLAPRPKER